MINKIAYLGGTASKIPVGRVAHGLMMMGRTPESTDEVCFASLKAGIDALPAGAKMFLNSGEFYSKTLGPENLEMLGRFFAKHPEYADKTFLSVKGRIRNREPDCSMENLRNGMLTVQRALGTHKKMDLYEPARIDHSMSIETIMDNLVVLLKEGHFAHIGLSECSAETLRRANAVYPVAAAEIEVNLWTYEEETKKVIQTARELNIAVIAYSPIGKGFLTALKAQPSGPALTPAGDYRARLTRFKDGNLEHNLQVVSALPELATKKGVTAAQLAIAWVAALGPHVIPLPGSSYAYFAVSLLTLSLTLYSTAARTVENCAAGDIELSVDEIATMNAIAEARQVRGDRLAGGPELKHLWG
ncbi:Aldo keto reductase [Mycena sanguinolenta]|uniref:Aldo keto reductase n=1 Tax=Mycena sanguinolenta TaxID=230812 RepID=A0A8H7CNQ7_9AGAR|nr:Aldo keto reductase [Mycena sanguinolenta]